MEKQLFIPKSYLTDKLDMIASYENKVITNIVNYLAWLGLVNQQLGDKANCKEILNVEKHESFGGEDHEDFIKLTFAEKVARWGYPKFIGYEVTYLESEMIANKNALANAWWMACNTYSTNDFDNWFNENFE